MGSVNSCKIAIFANGCRLKIGGLYYRSGYLTGIAPLFKAFSIQPGSVGTSLFARLCCGLNGPEVYFSREIAQDEQAGMLWEQAPLRPFSPKAEDAYLVRLEASEKKRGKPHEHLLNGFHRFLKGLGYSPVYSKMIDLALEEPRLIVEAKAIADDGAWTANIRAAVAQLHEYRWFYLPGASLLFLASRPVPEDCRRYLRDCHGIGSAWPVGEDFHVEDLDDLLPVNHQPNAESDQEEDT